VLVKSSGYERLDQAAIRGALQTRFKPATRGGIAVEVTHLLPVDYKESE
jgi:TonB family protein